ncbi:MAG: SurA N-terminal domain-containing protein [Paracoccaceae bacterium]
MATSIGSKTSKVFIWIILLLLIIGLGGFGIGGFGRSLNVIGSVGDKKISANRYIETLRQEISAFEQQSGSSISPTEAIKLGLDALALEKLIATTALDVEASQIGLSVGNKELAVYLNKISQFQGPDGNFNQDTYRMVLTQINKNVSDFEQDVREGLTRDMLKDGFSSGGLQTNTYAERIFNYINEERIVKTAVLTKNDLINNIPSPSNADLKNFLSESEERFTVPERKKITYAILTPKSLLTTVKVSEQELSEKYESDYKIYNRPEFRRVERIAFQDSATAQRTLTSLKAQDVSFDTILEERGLTKNDVNLGLVSKETLSDNVGGSVFALPLFEVSQVIESDLGPALYRTVEIISSTKRSFEDVREELKESVLTDKSKRLIINKKDLYEDLLVGGASLEDLVKETEFELKSVSFHSSFDHLLRDSVLISEAEKLKSDDYPTLFDLNDGSIAAMRLDEILPSYLPKLDNIRDKVLKEWELFTLKAHLKELADDIIKKTVPNSDWNYLDTKTPKIVVLNRLGTNPDSSFQLTNAAFNTNENTLGYIDNGDTGVIFEVTKVNLPNLDSNEAKIFVEQLNKQTRIEFENDIFMYFVEALQNKLGFKLDRAALNSIHQQF